MRPRGSEIMSRCCIYKDRAILRERLRAAMGFRLEDETDDSIPLRTYAEEALERKEPNWPILTVCDIACQGCMRARYYVTDACQGCVARSCIGSCRFGAISFSRGRSTIDPEKCRNCGMCMDACPYHAIVRLNVPCEAACPVRAIHKGNKGRAEIDFEKCTSCGRCMRACPFGAARAPCPGQRPPCDGPHGPGHRGPVLRRPGPHRHGLAPSGLQRRHGSGPGRRRDLAA